MWVLSWGSWLAWLACLAWVALTSVGGMDPQVLAPRVMEHSVYFNVVLAIFNTMTMSVMERTHEIGVMRAMGQTRLGAVVRWQAHCTRDAQHTQVTIQIRITPFHVSKRKSYVSKMNTL